MTYLAAREQEVLWQDIGWQSAWFVVLAISFIVLFMATWGRRIARLSRGQPAYSSLSRFHAGLFVAKLFIVACFGFGTLVLGYGNWVDQLLHPIIGRFELRLPGMLLACIPALFGFMGLWWSAYPLERLMHEKSILVRMNDALPVHYTPSFWEFFWANFRLQVLFVLLPVAMAMMLGDLGLLLGKLLNLNLNATLSEFLLGGSVVIVLFFAPILLARILHSSSLRPGSALRNGLKHVEQLTRQRCRDVRVWHTNHTMSNAMVMGLARPARYVMLSDLLIETLNLRQIQAVFAHEAGHMRYRHLAWYIVFAFTYIMVLYAPANWMFYAVVQSNLVTEQVAVYIVGFLVTVVYIYLFGMLARFFERQADAYAARTMELIPDGDLITPVPHELRPEHVAVTYRGAQAFEEALRRVVEVNRAAYDPRPRFGTPLQLFSQWLAYRTSYFLHPSPAERIEHLHKLAASATATRAFDRRSFALYAFLILYAIGLAALTVMWQMRWIG
jgi:STE24 endopeptidase